MTTPPRYTRQEIDAAYGRYHEVTRRCGETMDWSPWADLFTPDARYFEHNYGCFDGREEIRAWIVETMSTWPGNEMPWFPTDWYVIDEERGWVIAYVQNRMRDPGDGSIHQSANVSIIHYAGDGLWSYQEDVYNPANFVSMIAGWQARVDELRASDA